MAKKPAPVFACQECGWESLRWQGQCAACGAWNTLVERQAAPPAARAPATPVEMSALVGEEVGRLALGWPEFDRVLGGGFVPGSLVLLGGDPGIGKSTLLLQAAGTMAEAGGRVLYLSGEESARQLSLRARRLGIGGRNLYLLTETDLQAALAAAESLSPDIVIIDSIQTVYMPELASAPGSVTQVRECALALLRWAKERGVSICIVGHVTKEGELAGPRLVEHIVDVVLYLEGERFSSYRILRGVKNRFGSVAEIGVFEMTGGGLAEVENPSELFLAERPEEAVGSVIIPTVEGSRPLLVEVQALTSPSVLAIPRRTANGIDAGRLLLVAAVLSRRAGLALATQDIIVNVVGGLRVQEPAIDLAVALAIASSLRDRALPLDLVALGEVGLTGELRSVAHLERRLAEAARLGFRRCLLPRSALRRGRPEVEIELLPAATVREALRVVLA